MATYLVTGTNRGIGLEFVTQLTERGDTVLATCRDKDRADELLALSEKNEALEVLQLDVADGDSLQRFPEQLDGRPIDVFINNAGVYGPKDAPFGKLRQEDWAPVLHINAIAPVLLTQLLLDNLRKGDAGKLVYITSKMGSIADNSGGGQYIYRSSKAALNAAVKSLAIDLADEDLIVALLHPGWVETDMGGPNALIDTRTSVSGMLELIDGMSAGTSGQFRAYDGKPIPW